MKSPSKVSLFVVLLILVLWSCNINAKIEKPVLKTFAFELPEIPEVKYSYRLSSFVSTATVVYASPNGIVNASCGSPETPCNLVYAINITAEGGTVLLLDGIYTDVCTMNIEISMSIVAQNFGNAIIDCGQQFEASAFQIPTISTPVSFSGLTIQNGCSAKGAAVNSASNLVIDSCFFLNNSATSLDGTKTYGGAIYVTDSDVDIRNSVFVNNSAIGNSADSSGGAIFFGARKPVNFNAVNCSFIGNSNRGETENPNTFVCASAIGGAVLIIAFADYTNVTFQECTFENNFVRAVHNCAGLVNGQGISGALAMYLQGANHTATILATKFVGNSASAGWSGTIGGNGYGGALSLVTLPQPEFEGNRFFMSDCLFEDNYAVGSQFTQMLLATHGGAMVVLEIQETVISNTTFVNNTALSGLGGAVYIQNTMHTGSVYLVNVSFMENLATSATSDSNGFGGALTFVGYQNSTLAVEHSRFHNNTIVGAIGKDVNGGALSVVEADQVTLTNCSFSDNSAFGGFGSDGIADGGNAQGGAVYLEGAPCLISDSVWVGNLAVGGNGDSNQMKYSPQGEDGGKGGNAYGGALWSDSWLSIQFSAFTDNQASGGKGSPGLGGKAYGGAIAAEELIVKGSVFQNNLAGNDQSFQSVGGAIGVVTKLEISDSTFLNNSAISTSRAYGGALLCAVETSIDNVTFGINSIQIEGGDSGYGGAVYSRPDNFSHVELNSTKIFNNSVTGDGGGLFVNNTSILVIENTDISGNSAKYGGGLYIYSENDNQSVDLQHMLLADNTASFGGGAIFISNQTLEQINTTQLELHNNIALYGNSTASDIVSLTFAQPLFASVWPGETFRIVLELSDGAGNTVIDPTLSVTAVADSPYFVSGVAQHTALIDPETGHFVFAGSAIVSNTGTHCQLNFTSVTSHDAQFNLSSTLHVSKCPPSTYITQSSVGYLCEGCSSVEYNFDGKTCQKCPVLQPTQEYATCASLDTANRQLNVIEGYYPHPKPENPTELLVCRNVQACKEFTCQLLGNGTEMDVLCGNKNDSNSSDNCAEGYSDRLCSKCICNSDKCYYQTTQLSCLLCNTAKRNSWIEHQIYLVNGLLLVAIVSSLVTKAIPEPLIRSLWFFVQSSLLLMVPHAWPSWLLSLKELFPFLGSIQVYSLHCVLPPSWSNPTPQLLMAMASPVVLTVASVAGTYAMQVVDKIDDRFGISAKLLSWLCCSFCLSETKKTTEETNQTFRYFVLRSFLKVLGLLYMLLASNILNVLRPCDKLNYMPQYPWISCDSSEYYLLIGLATLFGLLYIIGIPALFTALLVANRRTIEFLKMQNTPEYQESRPLLEYNSTSSINPQAGNVTAIDFLYESYCLKAYWFEIVWAAREFGIAASIQLIPTTLGQVTCVTFILLAGMAVQNWLKPYEANYQYINTIEIVTSAVLMLTLNTGYHITELGSGVTKEVVQSLMLIINASVLVGITVMMLWQLVKMRRGPQGYSTLQ